MSDQREQKLPFASDYMQGAHPAVLEALQKSNMQPEPGYGEDHFCASARERIRKACACPDAGVFFFAGGTQANAVCISALLAPYQGVLSADTGHIAGHEAGAIEHGGHKVLTLPHADGKLTAEAVRRACEAYDQDANRDHIVMPGMVYISQPTENGTLYTKAELTALREVCNAYDLTLYADGARLAYALATPENDVTLADLAALCDIFYIGGTKCGALLGEAVVLPDPQRIPHFFSIMKQEGAVLAKGRLLGIQFDVLFANDLYATIGRPAIQAANRLRSALKEKGYVLPFETPTNQVFVELEDARLAEWEPYIAYGFWEKTDATHTVVRLATSWATTEDDVTELIRIL